MFKYIFIFHFVLSRQKLGKLDSISWDDDVDKVNYISIIAYTVTVTPSKPLYKLLNRICGLMVSVSASSVVDCVFEPRMVKPKIIRLVFAVSPLSMQHKREGAMTGWLGI